MSETLKTRSQHQEEHCAFSDPISTSGGLSCFFGSHSFIPLCWMCQKQTSVLHSSTEAEIISLDAGRNTNNHTQNQTKVPTQHDNFDLSDVDYVASNAKFSQCGAVLYIFDDNEAVIKIIIKGRSHQQ